MGVRLREGDGKNKKLLGGKGANLCEMTQIGLNVPPGFVISTEACLDYPGRSRQRRLPDGVMDEVRAHMRALEKKTGKGFGGARQPAAGLGALRLGHVHAGHDGHHPQPGPQRRPRSQGADPPHRQRALRLRRLPPLHPVVRQGRAGRARRAVRRAVRGGQDARRRQAGRGLLRPRPAGRRRALPARSCRSTPAGPSRRTRTSSWRSPSRRCSTPGAASARSTTAASSRSPRPWPTAPRSTW